MRLFWQHGYEATSVAALTKAMGVTSPSIYAAFGDKRGLFRAAVARYLARPRTPDEVIADASSAREAARGLMEGAAVAFTGEDTPPGSLLASSAIACSPKAADVLDELAEIRRDIERALRDRIVAGLAAGEQPADIDATDMAAYVATVIQGMSTMARDGASRETLLRIARTAMLAWPTVASADARRPTPGP